MTQNRKSHYLKHYFKSPLLKQPNTISELKVVARKEIQTLVKGSNGSTFDD